MSTVPFELETDARPRLGLVVLQADETIEDEFRTLFDPAEVRLQVTRIPSGAELTTESIAVMEQALPVAAGLFPEGAHFDVIGYACTSGTSQIGAARVAELIQSRCNTRAVTNPLTATFSAFKALEAARIGIVSPYTSDIAEKISADFEKAGFAVPRAVSFGEETEANVARITAGSITSAALELVTQSSVDAVFLSCTNLRTIDPIARLKDETNIPVLSSNVALAWHMSLLAKVRCTARMHPLRKLP